MNRMKHRMSGRRILAGVLTLVLVLCNQSFGSMTLREEVSAETIPESTVETTIWTLKKAYKDADSWKNLKEDDNVQVDAEIGATKLPDGYPIRYRLEEPFTSLDRYTFNFNGRQEDFEVTEEDGALYLRAKQNTFTMQFSSGRTEEAITIPHGAFNIDVIDKQDNKIVQRITVHVEDFFDAYGEYVVDKWIKDNNISSLSDEEKFEAAVRFVATNYSYDAAYRFCNFNEMMLSGMGDCWASAQTIKYICDQLHIPCRLRMGAHESSSSQHVNAVALINGMYYVGEAGVVADAPRPYYIYAEPEGYLTRYDSETQGWKILQYDGFENDITIPETLPSTAMMYYSAGETASKIAQLKTKIAASESHTVTAIGTNIPYHSGLGIGILNFYNGIDQKYEIFRIKNLVLPETVKKIDDYAFVASSGLESIYIPGGLESLGNCPFNQSTIKSENITFGSGSKYRVDTEKKTIFTDNDKTLVTVLPDNTEDNYVIPEGVTKLQAESFISSVATTVTFPSTLDTIQAGAFYHSKLTGLTIPGTIKTIELNAFKEAWSLNSVIIEEGVETIGNGAFFSTPKLAVVQVPESVTYMGEDVFTSPRAATNPFTIFGVSGSTANTYATNNNIAFQTIGSGYPLNINMQTWAESGFYYTGQEQHPTITVRFAGKTLTEGQDYEIDWDAGYANKDLVNARQDIPYKVTGKGAYSGSYSDDYTINSAPWEFDFTMDDMDYGTDPATCRHVTNGVPITGFWCQRADTSNPRAWYSPSSDMAPGTYRFEVVVDDKNDKNHRQAIKTATAEVREVPMESIAIQYQDNTTGSAELVNGGQAQLKVVYTPTNTSVDKTVTWESSDSDKVSVNERGVITAKALTEGSQVTITATVGTCTATLSVTVKERTYSATSITLDDYGNGNCHFLFENRTKQLSATVAPENATDRSVLWSSSDESVAIVDENGKVTALKAGEAVITAASASNPDVTTSVNVYVHALAIERMTLSDGSSSNADINGVSSMELGANKQFSATVTLNDPDATEEEQQIQWVSSNPEVATVDSNGNVTALAVGTTYIIPMVPAVEDDIQWYITNNYRCQLTVKPHAIPLGAFDDAVDNSGITIENVVDRTYSAGEPCYQFPAVTYKGAELQNGKDYYLSYENNTAAGSATMNINFMGDYSGRTWVNFVIDKADFTTSLIKDSETQEYKVNEKALEIKTDDKTVVNNGFARDLTEDLPASYDSEIVKKVEYIANFRTDTSVNNTHIYGPGTPGSYTYTVRYTLNDELAQNYYIPDQTATLTILGNIDFLRNEISLDQDSFTYTGSPIKPVPTVKDNGVTLVENTDYTVAYEDNIEIGTGKVILTGIGNYGGTTTIEFEINDGTVPVTGVTIQEGEEAVVEVGKTITLTPSIQPGNATNKKVTWSSLSPDYATVSQNGVVTGVAEGSSWISCETEDGNHSASCKVTVKKAANTNVAVKKVSLNKTSVAIETGKTVALSATIEPNNATNKNVTWSSSNTGVATVSSSGVVTARKAGTAVITCKSQSDATKKATCTITVKNPSISRVSLSASSMSLRTGENRTIQAYAFPSNAVITGVVWKSSNTGVVAISGSGSSVTLQARGAGTATISCLMNDDNGRSAYGICNVTVNASEVKVTGITLNQSSVSVELGSTTTLAATISPADATNRNITWRSSDTAVATVSSSGAVTGIGEGTATITCTAADGSGRSASCTVKVTDYTPTEAFSARLYEKCLGREPEEEGLEQWDSILVNKESTGAAVAYGFVFSQEYKNKNTSNEDFVEMLYEVFMNRPSDAGGKDAWVSALEQGASREKVFSGFAGSQEFTSVCDSYGIERGDIELSQPRDVNMGVTSFCARMYTKALGRSFDEDGLNAWCSVILDGSGTPEQVAENFINSQEFVNKNLSNEEYVKVLYRTFMGREYDQGGLDAWVSVLDSGTSRLDVLHGFSRSPEFSNIMAEYGL